MVYKLLFIVKMIFTVVYSHGYADGLVKKVGNEFTYYFYEWPTVIWEH